MSAKVQAVAFTSAVTVFAVFVMVGAIVVVVAQVVKYEYAKVHAGK